jgi:chemotaxis protein MotA
VDTATIIGIFLGFLCVIGAIIAGGSVLVFVHVPSMLIVIGGMLAATLIHFSMKQVLGIMPVIKKTMFYKLPAQSDLIQNMVDYSAICRRDGPLALEKELGSVEDPFLLQAMQMVVDGQEDEAIEDALDNEIRYLQERHADGKKIMEFMGAAGPAFGMIGTLIGLVAMLQNLSDPSGLGAGMAVALITTFYGALLANMLFIPLAGKLGIRSKEESLLREMIVQGVVGIAKGESPTVVRERMQVFVSAKKREEFKPSIGDKQAKAA